MTTTVYLAATALDQLRAAQAVLDRHLTTATTTTCRACGRPDPCPDREHATATFVRFRRLPRRTPGATHPELVHAHRLTAPTPEGPGT